MRPLRPLPMIVTLAALLIHGGPAPAAQEAPQSRDKLFELEDEDSPIAAPSKTAPSKTAPSKTAPAKPAPSNAAPPKATPSKNDTAGKPPGTASPTAVSRPAQTPNAARPKQQVADEQTLKPASKRNGAIRWSGFAQEEIARQYASPAHTTKVRTRAQLNAQGQAAEIKWKLGARLDYDAVFGLTDYYPDTVRKDRRLDLHLRENYADLSAGPLELRIGRQHIIWGEMVGLFFADVVSARDNREFILPEFEYQRLPQWALRAEHFQGDWHSEIIWIPYVTVDEIGRLGDDFHPSLIAFPGQGLLVRDRVKPSRSLSQTNAGLRVGVLRDGWDVSTFYYSSIDSSAHFTRSFENLPTPTVVYTPRHARIGQLGGTLAKDFGRFVLKSEAIYTRGRRFSVTDPADEDGVVKQNVLDYVVGVEFGMREQDVKFNAQAFQRIFRNHVSTLIPDKRESGLSFLVIGKFGALTPQFLVMQSLNRNDRLLQPSVDWNFARNYRLRVGLDILSGPEEGLFGQYSNRDRAYLELKYNF